MTIIAGLLLMLLAWTAGIVTDLSQADWKHWLISKTSNNIYYFYLLCILAGVIIVCNGIVINYF